MQQPVQYPSPQQPQYQQPPMQQTLPPQPPMQDQPVYQEPVSSGGRGSKLLFPHILVILVLIAVIAGLGFLLLSGDEDVSQDQTPNAEDQQTDEEDENTEAMRSVDELKQATFVKLDNSVQASADSDIVGLSAGVSGTGDAYRIISSHVLYDEGTYKMWYTGNASEDPLDRSIYYATSTDGRLWEKYDNTKPSASDTTGTNGRIPRGESGSGDRGGVSNPFVLKDSENYKMYYVGNDGDGHWQMFMATSVDGITWEKVNNQKLDPTDDVSPRGTIARGTEGTGDSASVLKASVVYNGNEYLLWYRGGDGSGASVFAARSPDGYTWTKINNEKLSPSSTLGTDGRVPPGEEGDLDSSGIAAPFVYYDGSNYLMLYTGISSTAVMGLCAESTDGISWQKVTAVYKKTDSVVSLCSFSGGTTGKEDALGIDHPSLVVTEDSAFYYYTSRGAKEGDPWRILVSEMF